MMYIILGIILIIFGYIFVKKGDKIRDTFGGFKEGFREGLVPVRGWSKCADEGGVCWPPEVRQGGGVIRYGKGNTWSSCKPCCGTGRIGCNNAVFGDPIHGTRKECQYMTAAENRSRIGGCAATGAGGGAKAEPPPAKDGVNGNIVTYNGNKYMTLPSKNPICPTTSIHDNANMARLRLANPIAWCNDTNLDPTHVENTECGKFREIPSGWKIASHNADSLHIAKNYSFHTQLLRTKTSALVTPYYYAANEGSPEWVASLADGVGTDILDGASEATRDGNEIKYDGNKVKSAACLLLIKQKEGEKIPKIIINDCLRQQELGRKCFECQPGYSLLNEGQKCQLVPIDNCKVQKNEWCQECEVGFEQGKSGNTCEKIPKVPVKNCAKQREWGASCITCNKYYNLNNEKCNPIAIKNCGIQKETICDECDPGYDTLKDKYNCELITIKNCSIQDGPKCKECKLGYRLSEDRRLCIVKPILNCAKRN
jgi:hypothetical protein